MSTTSQVQIASGGSRRGYAGSDAVAEGAEAQSQEAETRQTILVVEDEILVRMSVADQLREAGYVVIETANADEALAVLRTTRSEVKLVLSDLRMPGVLDGAGLARLLRLKYPTIKIVLTSGHLNTLDWIEHDGYFQKPYLSDLLIKHIRTLVK
jgi:CheY-like chemotaxis protein